MSDKLADAKELLMKNEFNKALIILQSLNEGELSVINRLERRYFLGICYFEADRFKESIAEFETCLKTAQENKLFNRIAGINYELSLVYFQLFTQCKKTECIEKSIDYCKKALDIYINNSIEEKNNQMMFSEESPLEYLEILIHLGVLHQIKNNFDESVKILLIAKTICQHYSKLKLLGQVYDELGTTYMLMGELELAGYYFWKSINAKMKINNKKGIEITLQKQMMIVSQNPQVLKSTESIRLKKLILEERV